MSRATALLLACLVRPAHAWITVSQSQFGTTIDHIQNESAGIDLGHPTLSLGHLWTMPLHVGDATGLGGTITWAWDSELCDALLPSFQEDFWFISLVSCASLRASVHRALDTWSMNSPHVKFTDVTAKCDAAGLHAATCPHAELAFALAGANQTAPSTSVPQTILSTSFRYTNGRLPFRAFGVPGKPYYYEVSRPVPSTIGGSIAYRDDVCWYADSQFCAPMHEWKRYVGEAGSAYVIGVLVFFAVWAALVLIVLHGLALAFKRATRMHQKLLHDGVEEPAEDEEPRDARWKERAEAACAVVARLRFRALTLRIFLIIAPWPYYLAIFQTCWKCFDFEAATAQEMGHLLGLAYPDISPAAGGANAYHAGISVNACADNVGLDVWADVRAGVPPGATVEPGTSVRASIMESLTRDNPRSCLQPDDLEALNVLYPACANAPITPVCAKSALNIGWIRLIVFALVPLAVAAIASLGVRGIAIHVAERSGASKAAAKAEEVARRSLEEQGERVAPAH